MKDDYVLFITLALYGAYVVMVARGHREGRSGAREIIALLAAIIFYTGAEVHPHQGRIQPA
jgi:hypothetical protein